MSSETTRILLQIKRAVDDVKVQLNDQRREFKRELQEMSRQIEDVKRPSIDHQKKIKYLRNKYNKMLNKKRWDSKVRNPKSDTDRPDDSELVKKKRAERLAKERIQKRKLEKEEEERRKKRR